MTTVAWKKEPYEIQCMPGSEYFVMHPTDAKVTGQHKKNKYDIKLPSHFD